MVTASQSAVPVGYLRKRRRRFAPLVNFAPWACRQSDVLIDCLAQRHASPSRSRVGHFAKRGEIDLGVDRGGRRITMSEKVADHLHRHALVEKMLGGRMPQRMCSPLPGDDADARQTISDDFPQGAPAERSDRRAHREEKRASEAGRADFPYVAENGVSDPSG